MLSKYIQQQTSRVVRNQNGFASLIIGLILVLVLALMTVGFGELARHEQQQSLNNQLGTQAYYGAESGVNDAIIGIKNNSINAATTDIGGVKCLPNLRDQMLGTGGQQFYYTCVKVTLDLKNIVFNNVAANEAKSTIVTASTSFNQMFITWNSEDGQNTPYPSSYTNTKIDSMNTWNAAKHPALIQISVTALGAGVTRAAMIANTYTAYLYPSNQNANGNFAGDKVDFIPGKQTGNTYEATINMNAYNNSGPYLIHMINFYDKSSISINGSNNVTFSGGQAMIDSTGKAKNVLKRIQVYVPLQSNANFNYALEGQNMCKRIEAQPGAGNTTFDIGLNAACDINK
jgi:Tfp pilus assembly protein PilX